MPLSTVPPRSASPSPGPGLHRIDRTEAGVDPGRIEFVPTIAEWFRPFREVGFAIDGYLELQAPPGAGTPSTVPAEWARRWPSGQVRKLTPIP